MHFLKMLSSLRVYLCIHTSNYAYTSKPLYLVVLQTSSCTLLVTRSEPRRFLHILFSASHLTSHRTQTLSLCDRYSRGAGDTHTQSRHQNCQVSGICFYLVIILQFSHLGFFFSMFNKIIWSLGQRLHLLIRPKGPGYYEHV